MYPTFYEAEGFYLALGMTYEQYWDGDATMTRAYKKAHEFKRQERNEELWLQGLYIYEAIARLAPILRMSTKKNVKAEPYLEEPYKLKVEKTEREEEQEERDNYAKMLSKVRVFATDTNSKFAKKGGQTNE